MIFRLEFLGDFGDFTSDTSPHLSYSEIIAKNESQLSMKLSSKFKIKLKLI